MFHGLTLAVPPGRPLLTQNIFLATEPIEGHSYEELNTRASRQRIFELLLEGDFIGMTGRVRHRHRHGPRQLGTFKNP